VEDPVKRLGIFMGSVLLSGTLFVGIGAAQNSDRNVPHGGWGQERIAKEVRHELVMLPYYGVFDDLEYSVNGNIVTRIGNVTRPKPRVWNGSTTRF
jgi:hyperosmotically inducible protein